MNGILGHRLEGQFVTAGYACIDLHSRTLDYAGAGHPPLLIRRNLADTVESLCPNGLILGPFPQARYHSARFQLEPGDRILMHTDGLIEALDGKGNEFGEERIHGILSGMANLGCEEFVDHLVGEVNRWADVHPGESLDDDLTLVVIDVKKEVA